MSAKYEAGRSLPPAQEDMRGCFDFPDLSRRAKAVASAVLVAVALLSAFVVAPYAASAKTHAATIRKLDEKSETVMSLVGGSTATSTAISLLPGDAGTPIAEKLVDLSSDFLVVIAAIYLEKYLLTIVGFVAFRVLVPLACALGLAVVLVRGNQEVRASLLRLSAKMTLLGVALFFVVPVSVFVSGMIESTYEESITHTIDSARDTARSMEEATQDGEGEEEPKGLLDTLASLPETIRQLPNEVTGFVDEAESALNNFIEALAVMVVTSCVIPLLVLMLFLWLIKSLLGVNIPLPGWLLRPRVLAGRYGRGMRR